MGCESEEAFECASKHLEWMLQDLKKILKAKENEKEPSSHVESLSNEKGVQAYRVKFEDGDVQQRSEIIKIKKEAHEKAMESYYIKRKSAEIIEVREKAHEIKRKENCRGRRRIKNSLERGKSKRCRQKEQRDTPNPVHPNQQPTLVRSNVQSPFAQGYNNVGPLPMTTYYIPEAQIQPQLSPSWCQPQLFPSMDQPHPYIQHEVDSNFHMLDNFNFTQLLQYPVTSGAFQQFMVRGSNSKFGTEEQRPLSK
ncbi:uncharacterized protein LOC131237530 [Magnolia sinica]|uniref:uncharacterized protein LOC131237530 n=1 Tax=Magnolia sinica TaxID=86752 RepID=UPI00265837C8|nr:uncharacterized protein LOC131237530 [Magnolia sinica]